MRLNVLAFTLGILFLQWQAGLPDMAWLGALASAALGAGLLSACLPHRRAGAGDAGGPRVTIRTAWRRAAAGLACAVFGFCWAALLAHGRLADALPAEWEGRDIALTGIVADLPQALSRGERFTLAVESVETAGARVPARLLLSWYRGREAAEAADAEAGAASVPLLRPGERWRLVVRLKRPHGSANPHGFDYEAWLLERGVRATGHVRPQGARRLDDFVARPATLIERLRDAVRRDFLAALPDGEYAGVLVALAVGDQRAITPAQWRVFRQTGITHLMSISGLHVTMIAALFAGLAGALWRRSEALALRLPAQRAAVAAGALAALAYALLAGFGVPTQRTLYMLGVVALALWTGRSPGASRTLALALLAVLLPDPWAVLAPGFWLSFIAVAVLFHAASAPGGARGWRAALHRWGGAQWAVTLGTLPVLLLLFQQFSLVSPLANALAIPVVSFLITPLALLFALLPWAPLAGIAHALLAGLMRGIEALAGWPLWEQAAAPWPVLLAAFAGALWLLLPRGFPARWLGVCPLLSALLWPASRPPDGAAWVDVLDVGHGLAVVVRTARHTLLYDAGPRYGPEADAGERVVVPFLRATGVRALDTLVVSHRDSDHAGGVESVRAALPVARIVSSLTPAELPGERCAAGQAWTWDGVRFALLHPPADDPERPAPPARPANQQSCVLWIGNAAGSVLLTGDIEAAQERQLIASGQPLRASVLLAAHHGSRSSSTAPFIAAVAPRAVLFSAGYRNRFGHPHPAVLERIGAAEVWRTDRDGALRVDLGPTLALAAERRRAPRYWHGK